MPEYRKPVPVPDHVTGKFWEGAKQHKLLIQRCPDCEARQFFPQQCCRRCLSDDLEWLEAKGTGKIYSYTMIYRSPNSVFEKEVPYIGALVELDDGVRIMSNIVEIEPKDVRVDMPVEVVFDDISATISLPKFRPNEVLSKRER